MNITTEYTEGQSEVAILTTHGDLDASNYLDLIAKAREVYQAGCRRLLIDLGDTPFMSSSGIVALHSIAMLLRSDQELDTENGWEAFRAAGREREQGKQGFVKLLNPQPKVERTLEMTGLKNFFDVYADRGAALTSFSSMTSTPSTGAQASLGA